MSYYRYHRTVDQAINELVHVEGERAMRRQVAAEALVLLLLGALLGIGASAHLIALGAASWPHAEQWVLSLAPGWVSALH